MATALLELGAAGVVCAVGQVSDAAPSSVVQQLHGALARGVPPAEALLRSRQTAHGDVLAAETAASFTARGAKDRPQRPSGGSPQRPRAARYLSMSALVDESRVAGAAPVSIGSIESATTLPSWTPHWS